MRHVLCLAAMVLVWAGAVRAELVNSKHNLSSLLGGGVGPCAYCHSVHNAVGGLGRPAYMGADLPNIAQVYNSVTLEHSITAGSYPVAEVGTVNSSDVPLCLTCHDGAFVDANLADPEKTNLRTKITDGSTLNIGENALDLRNDHPVGFIFNAGQDKGIKAPSFSHVHVEFGPGKNEMWCSTCHNPHGTLYPALLQTSNEGSALCLDCHLK